LHSIPEWIGDIHSLKWLNIQSNDIHSLPVTLCNLPSLKGLILGWGVVISEDTYIQGIPISKLPDWLGDLTALECLHAAGCNLSDLPPSLAQLEHLTELKLNNNPLNPELAAAYEQGLDAVKAYLRAKEEAQIVLNEAKLILVGEGEVGKTSLLAALRSEPFVEKRPTTHGVELDIKSLVVQNSDNSREIILNGWDFGDRTSTVTLTSSSSPPRRFI
jgi:internalin A